MFLPLSGGIDSCATAVIVYSAARLMCEEIRKGNSQVLSDVRTIAGLEFWTPTDPKDVVHKIFHTCFMGTTNSSKETRERARQLSEDIGSYHLDVNIDSIVSALAKVDADTFGRTLHFEPQGSKQESLSLQNLQSRSRMVLAYHFASTITLARKRKGGGALLVLGSANVYESHHSRIA